MLNTIAKFDITSHGLQINAINPSRYTVTLGDLACDALAADNIYTFTNTTENSFSSSMVLKIVDTGDSDNVLYEIGQTIILNTQPDAVAIQVALTTV